MNGRTINGFESEWGYTIVIIVIYFVSLSGRVPKMSIAHRYYVTLKNPRHDLITSLATDRRQTRIP